jgi:(p)ppGpp synthase/HD superfamily hydrolase
VPQELIAASLLHDCIEDDPDFTPEICRHNFGDKVTTLVSALTKSPDENASDIVDPELRQKTKYELNRIYLERVKGAGPEALKIKLADRYNNLAAAPTIRTTKPAKYDRYVRETSELFLPLARTTSRYFYDRFAKLLKELEASS